MTAFVEGWLFMIQKTLTDVNTIASSSPFALIFEPSDLVLQLMMVCAKPKNPLHLTFA